MKILLFGKNGRVGWELQRAMAPLGELYALGFEGAKGLCGNFTDLDGLVTTVRQLAPDIMANPLTFILEQAREALIWGRLPNWLGLGLYTLAATAVAWAGYAWFHEARKEFADVL